MWCVVLCGCVGDGDPSRSTTRVADGTRRVLLTTLRGWPCRVRGAVLLGMVRGKRSTVARQTRWPPPWMRVSMWLTPWRRIWRPRGSAVLCASLSATTLKRYVACGDGLQLATVLLPCAAVGVIMGDGRVGRRRVPAGLGVSGGGVAVAVAVMQ